MVGPRAFLQALRKDEKAPGSVMHSLMRFLFTTFGVTPGIPFRSDLRSVLWAIRSFPNLGPTVVEEREGDRE